MFRPFEKISHTTALTLVTLQVIVFLSLWQSLPAGLIPSPLKIGEGLGGLITSSLLWDNVLVSLVLTLKALFFSVLITLIFSYLSVVPFFRPIAQFIVKCRYLTLTGLIFIFTLLTRDGSQLKLSLLAFGIVPFFTTSFMSVILQTNAQEFELCQTLGYSRWQCLYEVIIVGKADQVFDIVRQNFAIAWMMITMVEGLSMSEGGIGTILIKYNKYNDLVHVIALQTVIFCLGLFFDYLLKVLRNWFFPYTKL